jgi:hypothetical protein
VGGWGEKETNTKNTEVQMAKFACGRKLCTHAHARTRTRTRTHTHTHTHTHLQLQLHAGAEGAPVQRAPQRPPRHGVGRPPQVQPRQRRPPRPRQRRAVRVPGDPHGARRRDEAEEGAGHIYICQVYIYISGIYIHIPEEGAGQAQLAQAPEARGHGVEDDEGVHRRGAPNIYIYIYIYIYRMRQRGVSGATDCNVVYIYIW